MAAKALEAAPGDQAIRLLTAANLASMGLVTVAGEVLDGGDDGFAGLDGAVQLRSILSRMPSDSLGRDAREGYIRRNLDAIAARNAGAGSLLESALRGFDRDQHEYFRSIDGNVLRRTRGSRGLGSFHSLLNQRGLAKEFAARAAPPSELMGKPVVIEGISPPWIFAELHAATGASFNGYRRRLMVVQADAAEFLEGLSQADLSEAFRDSRVELYLGPSAAESLRTSLGARVGTVMFGQYIPVLATRTRCTPVLEEVLRGLEKAQAAEHREAAARVEALYAGRDPGWWSARYRSGQPLRVLIPTCRFSTFVRYASEDLAEGFRAHGHDASVFMEPDEFSCLSSIGYLREIERFRPDLIVLANYPRAAMGANFPANIPYVCWVQDAMPHLFDAALGESHGPLDFVAGVRLVELTSRFKYPKERAIPFPVVVSASKFRAAPRTRLEGRPRIVFATHHGETPGAMHARLVRDSSKDPLLPRAMEALRPLAEAIAKDILAPDIKQRVRGGVLSVISSLVEGSPQERGVSILTHAYVIPMIDRMLRHQTAAWAASIAERRGWDFVLCGKNWDTHPTLARFAGKPIEHGDALKEDYNRSTVHLHASFHGPLHQRVFECATAGGLPACRLVWPSVSPLLPAAISALRDRLGDSLADSASRIENGVAYIPVADHPELRRVAECIEKQGMPALAGWSMGDACRVPLAPPPVADTDPSAWTLVDPILKVSFRSEAELEALIERAALDGPWRAERSSEISVRVEETLTHEAMAGRLTSFIASSLGAAGASPPCARGLVGATISGA